MTSTEETKESITQEISNELFELKDKLTDGEFKSIMDKLGKLNTKSDEGFYKFYYYYPFLIHTNPKDYRMRIQKGETILKIEKQDELDIIKRCINEKDCSYLYRTIENRIYHHHYIIPSDNVDDDCENTGICADISVYNIEKM